MVILSEHNSRNLYGGNLNLIFRSGSESGILSSDGSQTTD